MLDVKNILVVCTGNSCRSVMAEALLKDALRKIGRGQINIASAGVSTAPGMLPTENTIEVMKEEGLDVSNGRSLGLTNELIERADLVLVMEQFHKNEIVRRVPQAEKKIKLFREYVEKGKTGKELDIPDPIGKPLDFYRQTKEIIKGCIREIVKTL